MSDLVKVDEMESQSVLLLVELARVGDVAQRPDLR